VIIARYLTKEIGHTLLAVTIILLFVFMCNQFVRYLSFVASGKYAAWVLIHIVLLQVPVLLGLLLPLGLFLGIMLGFGRLYAESEMTVLYACGFSTRQLTAITMGFACLIMIVVAILSLWVKPIMSLRSKELLSVAKSGNVLETIVPGRFQVTNNGQRVYYVEKLSHDRKRMKNVFMAQTSVEKPAPNTSAGGSKNVQAKPRTLWTVVLAKKGNESVNKDNGQTYVVTHNGKIYKGAPGDADFRIVDYQDYGIRTTQALATVGADVETAPTWELLYLLGTSKKAMAELQWRLSVPLSVLLLAFLAVPLSRLKPRQSKFTKILPAAIVYIVYANLMFVGREWVESGAVPAWLGMWWIHGLVFLFALWLMWRQRRQSPRRFRRRVAKNL
jgi:lipopolysaccharide export system permease protein